MDWTFVLIIAVIMLGLALIVAIPRFFDYLQWRYAQKHGQPLSHEEAMAATPPMPVPPIAQPRDDYEGYQAQSYYPPPGQQR